MNLLAQCKVLKGERVDLIPLSLDYVNDLFEYSQMPEFFKYLSSSTAKTPQDVKVFLQQLMRDNEEGKRLYLMIKHKQHQKVIGTIGLTQIDLKNARAQVGYGLSPLYWGQNFFVEALNVLLSFAFDELDFWRLEVWTRLDNAASIRSVGKAGFLREAVLKEFYALCDGSRRDCAVLALTKSHWQKKRQSSSRVEGDIASHAI